MSNPKSGLHGTNPRSRCEQRQRQAALGRAERRCLAATCARRPKLVPLPFSERRVWACDVHRGPLMLGAMAALVAHG